MTYINLISANVHVENFQCGKGGLHMEGGTLRPLAWRVHKKMEQAKKMTSLVDLLIWRLLNSELAELASTQTLHSSANTLLDVDMDR